MMINDDMRRYGGFIQPIIHTEVSSLLFFRVSKITEFPRQPLGFVRGRRLGVDIKSQVVIFNNIPPTFFSIQASNVYSMYYIGYQLRGRVLAVIKT